jgi:uncharacterized membrane protein
VSHGWVGQLHTALAVLALVAGGCIFPWAKGTRRHKIFGYTYATAMLGTTASAFAIYHLTGHFGVFHVAAVVSFLTLIAAMVPVLTRRPRGSWLYLHYKYTGWSYVGLLAAAASEAAVRLPSAPFWPAVAIGSALFFTAGGLLIARMTERTLAKVRHRAVRPLF